VLHAAPVRGTVNGKEGPPNDLSSPASAKTGTPLRWAWRTLWLRPAKESQG
jgi:hypothetical protein